MQQDALKGIQFVYNLLTMCVLPFFILFRSRLIATWPLPSSEGCRPLNLDVDGFRAGVWVGDR